MPLIGGQLIGQTNVIKDKPAYIASFDAFAKNDKHSLNHFDDVPFVDVTSSTKGLRNVDIMGTTCPCAGLSSLSPSSSADSAVNDWMRNTAELVLSTVKPKVFWGENAPALFTHKGRLVVKSLQDIASKHGYSLMLYHTKSMLHGTPQIRARTFYLFFKGDRLPVFNYYNTAYTKIEDLLDSVKAKDDPINKHVPSQDDSVYRYLLESLSMNHAQYQKSLKKTVSVHSYVFEHRMDSLAKWARENDEKKLLRKLDHVKQKFNAGQGAWLKNTTVPRDHIGAFVGHMPFFMTHHKEDRYITLSEAKAIMGLPKDFVLLDPKQSINHLCQNVPVRTAEDMTKEIVASLNGEREWLKASFTKQSNIQRTHHRQTIQLSLF